MKRMKGVCDRSGGFAEYPGVQEGLEGTALPLQCFQAAYSQIESMTGPISPVSCNVAFAGGPLIVHVRRLPPIARRHTPSGCTRCL